MRRHKRKFVRKLRACGYRFMPAMAMDICRCESFARGSNFIETEKGQLRSAMSNTKDISCPYLCF